MPIPLLETVPKTQNQRVAGFDVLDEDDPQSYRLVGTTSEEDLSNLIWAAYRQIFSEHLILESYRQPQLESQLRNRSITVRDFIRRLGKTDVYRQLVADTNSNYRLVDLTFKRFLGRATYDRDEQITWSIVIATKGLHGFIDAVVDSDEYRQNFGDDTVPYQRRRMAERPFNLVNPRYSDYWRNRLIQHQSFYQARQYQAGDLDRKVIRQAIPANFLRMAEGVLPNEVNYQRTAAQVSSQVQALTIPDMSRQAATSQVAVKPTQVSLPYRYLPSRPQV